MHITTTYYRAVLTTKRIIMPTEREKSESLDEQIITAAQEGQTDKVIYLLKNGANANATDRKGSTPLIISALNGDVDTVKVLLAKGADVNAVRYRNISSLMNASHNGDIDTVSTLLTSGADVNAANRRGETSLFYAVNMENRVLGNSFELSKLLISSGADIYRTVNNQKIIDMYPEQVRDEMISIFNKRKSVKKGKDSILERLNEYGGLLKGLWTSRSEGNRNAENAIDIIINHRFHQKPPTGFHKFMPQNNPRGKGSSTNLREPKPIRNKRSSIDPPGVHASKIKKRDLKR